MIDRYRQGGGAMTKKVGIKLAKKKRTANGMDMFFVWLYIVFSFFFFTNVRIWVRSRRAYM